MSPRPILKGSNTDGFKQPYHSHHYAHTSHPQQHSVHFPPSPALTRTFFAHSPSTYDRSPIVVSPNDCALPERGCPGRTYFEETSSNRKRANLMLSTKGYHPKAFAAPALGPNYDLPPLVPDLSSESDESDGMASLPPPSSVTFGPHGLPSSSTFRAVSTTLDITMHTHGYAAYSQDAALAFLPYSPSSYPYEVVEDNIHKEKSRRRRDRKHESSVDPDRISSGDAHIAHFAHTFSCLSISRSPSPSRSTPPPPRKKSHRRQQSSFTPAFSTSPVDGCLGGF
jgi:hypothetical protein